MPQGDAQKLPDKLFSLVVWATTVVENFLEILYLVAAFRLALRVPLLAFPFSSFNLLKNFFH
jgi:hypothetical protein